MEMQRTPTEIKEAKDAQFIFEKAILNYYDVALKQISQRFPENSFRVRKYNIATSMAEHVIHVLIKERNL